MFNIKNFLIILALIVFFLKNSFAFEYNDLIKKIYSDRKLDNIEGIWKKTYANEGPTGCITMFFK